MASFRNHSPVIRQIVYGFLVSTIIVITGCGKSPKPSPVSQSAIGNQQSAILTLHWLGKKRLSTESNATNFISIWNMPESLRLENQTLDKLSTAPWRLLTTATPLSNAPSALLRPLLDDLVQEESYLEISAATNQPAEIVLAIKLPPDRTALWQTNLPVILKSIVGDSMATTQNSEPKAQAADFRLQTSDLRLELARSSDWTILSITDVRHQTSDIRLQSQIRSRLNATGVPFAPAATNQWISGHADLSALSRIAGWSAPSFTNLPTCQFSATGDGTNVRTFATLTFPLKAPIELEPWNIPTNFIHDPLTAFTALRGVKSPASLMPYLGLDVLGVQKNSFYSWAVAGYPLQTYFAYPDRNATDSVHSLSNKLAGILASDSTKGFPGKISQKTNDGMLVMDGLPFASPRIGAVKTTGQQDFVFGGLIPIMATNRPMPGELIAQLNARSGWIYYDWEITGPRIESWIYISQTMRLVFSRAQLPEKSAGLFLLKALQPRAGNSTTAINLAAPDRLIFTRTSTLGITGAEAHLLADWMESPDFPVGLNTFRSPPMRGLLPPTKKSK